MVLAGYDIGAISTFAISWFVEHGVTIVFIILLAVGIRYFGSIVIEKGIRKLVPRRQFRSPESRKLREDTLVTIGRGTLNVVIWITVFLMVLSEAGINIGPLLAAAGVAGLAIGFGGQYLIRDLVAGLFIIIENQYRVGDVVCLDGTCGLVEDISIRMATLRDLDGTVHHVPHGSVAKVSNLSKEYARVNLNIGVAYDSDLENVIKVVNDVGRTLAEDSEWKGDILIPIKFERVDDFADSAIIIKVLGKTRSLRQWAVAGEFRKRIKIAFDRAGIEIPFPQRVVYAKK